MDEMLAATAAAEDAHFWFRGLRRTARQLLRAAAGERRFRHIVDCGAGTGRNLDWLNEFGTAIGVELTPLALAVGRARHRRLVRGSVAALPIADGSAGLATSFDVLYCLDEATEAAALREMWRVLEPGGLALVNVAALDVLRGSHSALTHEVRRYTPARLRMRLAAAGFAIERLTFTNCALFPPALLRRSLERLRGQADRASDADLRTPARPINAALDGVLAIEAAALRITNLPIGTSLMALARKGG
jgi:SAM-dependent methyltransferase